MNAADRLEDSFPHGTLDAYRDGCRSSQCPALISCRDVHRRYSGDFAFKKAIDAGATLNEILQGDQERRAAWRAGDREAARALRHEESGAAPQRAPAPVRKPSPQRPAAKVTRKPSPQRPAAKVTRKPVRPHKATPAPRSSAPASGPGGSVAGGEPAWAPQLRQLHADKRTDPEIAAALGSATSTAASRRRSLQLSANRVRRPKAAKAPRAPRVDMRGEISRLHGLRYTDAEIAAELGVSAPWVGTLRRELKLQPHRRTRSKWDGVELQPCGTNAAYVRGCHCDACEEAHRTYHREYVARRRSEGIPAENHGTAYGYQLGCHDRELCPASPTCSDASIAEERRRRREAGIPEQPPRVDAQPVREHVRALMSNGNSLKTIAAKADISLSGLGTLLYGRSGARKGELAVKIDATKATKLLALT